MSDSKNPPQSDTTSNSELREQLEEFALHLKPGTTKGKHRTAIFDTLELTKLVQALIAQEANKARLAALGDVVLDYGHRQALIWVDGTTRPLQEVYDELEAQLKAQNRSNDE